jgi:ribosomal protein L31
MAKQGIHPEWYPEAKVYCNGELVMTVGSTKPELHVDVWSGNHPFYTVRRKLLTRKDGLSASCGNTGCWKAINLKLVMLAPTIKNSGVAMLGSTTRLWGRSY